MPNSVEETEIIAYKTSSPAGDLISFMAGFKQMYLETGKKAVVYQRIGMQGVSYADSIHPFQNPEGEPVCMPQTMFDMLRPLLLSQEYIADFRVWKGEEVFFDMDIIRQKYFTNQPRGSLNRWFNYPFPQMASDLSKPYLFLSKQSDLPHRDKVIINITQRHRNYISHYFFLKEHEQHLLFAGLQKERDLFCKEWGLDIPLLVVNDFLELANILNGCRFFLGNQSFLFQICEALKVPRILEVFPNMPNVVPIGEHAYDFYDPDAAKFYFNKLMNQ